ncbi:MAG: UDP-N-acetylmuramoyl-L-alanyl-D-glutamate--2,6-diaminopimelate ligase [Gemmatimonadaceae bacterium]|jgi:UDP-N-acetylmuramoyl-L-alanyl-D-glutamate--2,6-diaminopimelate ligase|nr:UDP-N-acetylmuramoyl-L-alanyl-D-glutamate--2,6-diaminopimelate ligase [Gemmatimonadaceae bacterium]
MNLRTLLDAHAPVSVTGVLDRPIDTVVSDSRQVARGSLFVAIRGGQELDRHAFVEDAVERGAEAVVVEEAAIDTGAATRVVVDDSRRALAALAARLHGHPSRAMQCVGVTGTNGKSTTASIIRHLLAASGSPAAYLGTLGFHWGDQVEPLPNTTPEAGALQALLARARDAGCRSLAMEVSSHGLALGRVQGIGFDAAVFTNLTRDHLDFHGSEEEYFAAKSLLFRDLAGSSAAVLNADDPRAGKLAELTPAQVWTFGESGADVRLRNIRFDADRTHLSMDTPQGEFEVETALTGRYNSSNVVAAVTTGFALGIEGEAIRRGVADVAQIPGRFERIDEGQPFQVLVDYAHTPAGLETVLRAARELTSRRLLCVFGCGGDRDTGKRPMMGQVAEALADAIYLTADNPRSESPRQIIDQIAAGMRASDAVVEEPDRRTAIHAALGNAEVGDVVVLAGKGDEPYQILDGGRILPFDDRDVAREALRDRGVAGEALENC